MRTSPALDAPPSVLRLDVRPDRDRVIVTPHGEVDVASTDPVEREVLDLCDRGFETICLDLRDVTFFDSCGLRLLLRLDAHLREAGRTFELIAGDGAAARVLRLTRLDDRFRHATAT